eukprot:CAMPEP_0196592032 /NCGR_PEP_ID=MMETSP1081-20130531/71658_1 /TAXON_ID=36882 /ORGANISM="Pyramimonas amylifera, Strain CCMP720" /LENGTH=276 /DNA_ID=CAMNT_0041915597 /DNA_START=94 /DNA_END=921 /DNA_ORIENTATION=+
MAVSRGVFTTGKTILPNPPSCSSRSGRRVKLGPKTLNTKAAIQDIFKKFDKVKESMRFEKWAPRSARAWGKEDYLQLAKKESGNTLLSEGLLQQLQEEDRQTQLAQAFTERSREIDGVEASPAEFNSGKQKPEYDVKARADELNSQGYFSEDKEDFVLDGEALAILCYNKYGFFHDMAIKQVSINTGGMARWVSLNLYFGYVGLRGFPYNDAEYIEKCDAVAAIICMLDQEEFVFNFFKERVYPRRGLPSRPRQDTAVSLRLNQSPTWNAEVAEAW